LFLKAPALLVFRAQEEKLLTSLILTNQEMLSMFEEPDLPLFILRRKNGLFITASSYLI
jgi:hypothetical protein